MSVATGYSPEYLISLQAKLDSSNVSGFWSDLAANGDSYADDAAVVTGATPTSPFHELIKDLVKIHWDNTTPAGTYELYFDEFALKHAQNYLNILQGGNFPNTDEIIDSYHNARQSVNDSHSLSLPPEMVFDSVWDAADLAGVKLPGWDNLLRMEPERDTGTPDAGISQSSALSTLAEDLSDLVGQYTGEGESGLGGMGGNGLNKIENELGGLPIGEWVIAPPPIGLAKSLWYLVKHAVSPLTFDLDGDGIELVSLEESETRWDLTADGFAEHTGWTTGDDGFLAIDINDNGVIDNNSELFGTETLDGFTVLQAYDTNEDGVIDSSDENFAQLLVWQDANSDGFSQAGELQSLPDWNILSISLSGVSQVDIYLEGNHITHASTYTYDTGAGTATRDIKDVWFDFDATNTDFRGAYVPDPDSFFLPSLRGYGTLPDLYVSMSLDSEGTGNLKSLVQELVAIELAELFTSDTNELITDIFYRWAGVDDLDPVIAGSSADAQQIGFLAALFGESYLQNGHYTVPTGHNAEQILSQLWDYVYGTFRAHLLAQVMFGFFDGEAVPYDLRAGTFKVDLDLSEDFITGDLSTAAGNATDGEAYWRLFAEFMQFVKDPTVTETGWLDTAVYDSGVSGLTDWSDVEALFDPVLGEDWTGTSGADTHDGTSIADIQRGGDGDDVLSGLGGDDEIHGQNNNDTIYGGDGDDTLYGEGGNDTLYGGDGNDYLDAGTGTTTEVLDGGAGSDYMKGTSGATTYYYSSGADGIEDTGGTDTIIISDNTIGLSDLTFLRTPDHTLAITVGTVGSIYILNHTDPGGSKFIESIQFTKGGESTFYLTDLDDIETKGSANSETIAGVAGSGFGGNLVDIIYGYGGNDVISGADGNDTIYGGDDQDTITGGNGDDVLYGDAGHDNINGGNNDDEIYGGDGNDYLDGANGLDEIWGGNGNDTIYGRDQADILHGDAGDDYLEGGSDTDTLYGDAGNDTLVSGDSSDILYGGDNDDTLIGGGTQYGGDGNDYLEGRASATETMSGGDGDDTFNSKLRSDTQDGGAGNDDYWFYYDSGDGGGNDTITDSSGSADRITLTDTMIPEEVTYSVVTTDYLKLTFKGSGINSITIADHLDTGDTKQVESLYFNDGFWLDLASYASWTQGTASGDTQTGGSGADTILGRAGADTIDGAGGDDALSGDAGDDTITGGAGNDRIHGGSGTDTVLYSAAAAGIVIDLAAQVASDDGDGGADMVIGVENVTGSAYGDVISGDANANVLDGGNGDDILAGGAGNDTLTGGSGTDTIDYRAAVAGISVDLSTNSTSNDGDSGADTLSGIENVLGSAFNDAITGDAGANTIEAGDGDDIVDGGAGDDALDGGAGVDTLSYANASSAVSVNLATTSAQNTGGAGTDTIAGFENLIGSSYNDTLVGDNGDNTIVGGVGTDFINGAGGNNDTVDYSAAAGGVTVNLSTGSASNDGDGGSDTLAGIEHVIGSSHGDTITGSGANNRFRGGAGNDVIDGGSGNDTIDYSLASGAVTANLSTGAVSNDGDGGNDTLTSIEIIVGSEYGDTITGKASSTIYGGSGNDTIYLTGSSTVYGGFGDDTVYGASSGSSSIYADDGDDTYDASAGGAMTVRYLEWAVMGITANLATGVVDVDGDESGDDTLVSVNALLGTNYNDVIYGNSSANTLTGMDGNDLIYGGSGNDVIWGNDGNDTLYGDDGLDIIYGGAGVNTLYGGSGNDNFYAYEGTDNIDGGSGVNTVTYVWSTAAVAIYLSEGIVDEGRDATTDDTLTSINNATGSSYDDLIIGDVSNNTLYGGSGNDVVIGGDGNDTIYCAAGNNIMDGGSGNDQLTGGSGNDQFVYSSGLDSVWDTGGTDTLLMTGGTTINDISISNYGTDEAKVILTASVDEIIVNDIRNASASKHVDFISFDDGFQTSLPDYASWMVGTSGNDSTTGNSSDNTIVGKAGNDTIDAGAGNDDVHGGADNDTIDGGDGDDLLHGGAGDDTLNGQDGLDTLYGGDGDDIFTFESASAFNDVDQIMDFAVADDALDIADLLSGFTPGVDDITEWVQITDNGTDSTLYVDANGGADNFVAVAAILGVTGLTDEAALVTAGTLVVS